MRFFSTIAPLVLARLMSVFVVANDGDGETLDNEVSERQSRSSFLDTRRQLSGLAIDNFPFVARRAEAGQAIGYDGYLVDLMEAVTRNTSFGFTVQFELETPSHAAILEKVADRKFDFALADLLATDERRLAVDFSRPIVNVSLAAVVLRSDFVKSATLADLVERTVARSGVAYGCVRGGTTHRYLSESTHPIARRIWAKVAAGGGTENLVNHFLDGVELVNHGNFVLFGESPEAIYRTGQECSLKVLLDEGQLDDYRAGHYAIAMAKNAKELAELNAAIERFEVRGDLRRLQQRYWNETDSC